MRIGFDVDGVGHTFSAGVLDHMKCEGVENLWKSGPRPDPYWDWYKDWNWTDKQFVEFCNRAADHGCLFTGHVRPGYKEAIYAIANMGHEVIIVTDRSFGSDPSVSEKLTVDWFRDEGIHYDELIFSRDKTVGNTEAFIDDRLENYDAMRKSGMNCTLLNRPWNLGDDQRQRVDTLEEYVNEVRTLTQARYAII